MIICSFMRRMKNLIFFTSFFLCMNVPSLANESIDGQGTIGASTLDQQIIAGSPPFSGVGLHSGEHHLHHTAPNHHHWWRRHHRGHHNPPWHHRGHYKPPRHHWRWPHPIRRPPLPPPFHDHQTPPPQPKKDPQNCSTALIYVDGCVPDLISSFFGRNVRVNADCCHTIARLSGTCFEQAFAQFETPSFTSRLKGFCAQLQ